MKNIHNVIFQLLWEKIRDSSRNYGYNQVEEGGVSFKKNFTFLEWCIPGDESLNILIEEIKNNEIKMTIIFSSNSFEEEVEFFDSIWDAFKYLEKVKLTKY